jgi:hypothetical protein
VNAKDIEHQGWFLTRCLALPLHLQFRMKMARDTDMQDAEAAEEEQMMYGHGAMTEEELDEK